VIVVTLLDRGSRKVAATGSFPRNAAALGPVLVTRGALDDVVGLFVGVLTDMALDHC
jgi:hypothetical protein